VAVIPIAIANHEITASLSLKHETEIFGAHGGLKWQQLICTYQAEQHPLKECSLPRMV